jgi:beta-xylosidase
VRPSTATIPVDGTVAIRATVTNAGARTGVAVPQLYLSDPVATVTRPVRRLIGFTRVEPDYVVLTVAQSAADPGLSAHVELEGEVRIVDHTRAMHTPATASDI